MKKNKKHKQVNFIKLRYVFAVVATILVVVGFQTWESFLPYFLYPIIEMFILFDSVMPESIPNNDVLQFAIIVFPTILFYFLVGLGIEKLLAISKSKK